jgi:hypothetical protein
MSKLKQFLRPGPPNPDLADRKAEFDDICRYVTARDSWVVSVRGEREIRVECLPDSPLAAELRVGAAFKLGDKMVRLPPYDVTADGEGERVTGAGIVRVRRYSFELPRPSDLSSSSSS